MPQNRFQMAGIGGWGAGNSLNLVWSLLKKRYK